MAGPETPANRQAKRMFAEASTAKAKAYKQLSRDARRAYDDFGFFRARYFGRVSSPWQEDAAYKILAMMATDDREYAVISCPPGSGKSTCFTHDVPAWLLVRDRTLRILIGSATQNLARSYSSRLRNTFDRLVPVASSQDLLDAGLAVDATATLAGDFGAFRPATSQRWRDDEFVIAQLRDETSGDKESSVTAYGRDTGVLGGRFDLCVWDDLVDRKTLRTADARGKLEEDFDNELETRLEPRGLFVLQGQRMGPGDLYRYALDKRGAPPQDAAGHDIEGLDLPAKYHHIRYPAHDEQKCTGAHPRDAKAWPEVLPARAAAAGLAAAAPGADRQRRPVPDRVPAGGPGPGQPAGAPAVDFWRGRPAHARELPGLLGRRPGLGAVAEEPDRAGAEHRLRGPVR